MIDKHFCVIMAGGSANSFWPVTRETLPKQFLPGISRGKSLVRVAYERSLGLVPKENILIVTPEAYEPLVRREIPELEERNLLLEPYAKRTAPCIAYATYCILQRCKDAVMLVTPSDLTIDDNEKYRDAAARALDFAASSNVLVTLGVFPTRPDPNYGYIQAVGGKEALREDRPVKVKTFTEKPDDQLA